MVGVDIVVGGDAGGMYGWCGCDGIPFVDRVDKWGVQWMLNEPSLLGF